MLSNSSIHRPRVGGRLLAVLLGCLHSIVGISIASADEAAPLLGGQVIEPQSSNLAYLLTSQGTSCSGMLVGSRTVLTAAHCIDAPLANSEFAVLLYNVPRAVAERFIHPSYELNAPVTFFNAQFDLGVIILEEPVTEAAPTPILFNDPVGPGESVIVAGFGANEFAPGEELIAKAAELFVSSAFGGLLQSNSDISGANVCQGDSGGPSIQDFGITEAVVGVTSLTTTQIVGGVCVSTGPDESTLVDLQSASSQQFLSSFPDITFVSGMLIKFKVGVDKAVSQSAAVLKARTSAALLRNFKALVKSVSRLNRLADPRRARTIRAVNAALSQANTARSYPEFVAHMVTAQRLLKKLARMGVL